MSQERGEVSCDWWSDAVRICDWLQAQAALERVKEESAAVSAALGEQRAAAETVTAEREQLRRENEQLQQTIAEKDQGRCQRNFAIHNILRKHRYYHLLLEPSFTFTRWHLLRIL